METKFYLFCFLLLTMSLPYIFWGCGSESFARPENIRSLRVLGIKAEPPSLAPGRVVKLSALAVTPKKKKISYQWFVCKRTWEVGNGCVGKDGAKRISEKSTASYQIPKNFIPKNASLATQFKGIYLAITLLVKSDKQELIATKRIIVTTFQSNKNPKLQGIQMFEGTKKEALKEPWIVEKTKTYRLTPKFQRQDRESYVALKMNGSLETVKETLFFSWFTTSGVLQGRTSDHKKPDKHWNPPKQPETTQLFLVIRDGRGGMDWLTREVKSE